MDGEKYVKTFQSERGEGLLKANTHRVQLSRKKGWRMPPNTVKVDRTTPWGNPYKDTSREVMLKRFREWISRPEQRTLVKRARMELRGKNLACWCPLDKPCHVDLWLELLGEQ